MGRPLSRAAMALMKFRHFEPLIRIIDVFSRCCASSLEFHDHSELGESQLQRRNFGRRTLCGSCFGQGKMGYCASRAPLSISSLTMK